MPLPAESVVSIQMGNVLVKAPLVESTEEVTAGAMTNELAISSAMVVGVQANPVARISVVLRKPMLSERLSARSMTFRYHSIRRISNMVVLFFTDPKCDTGNAIHVAV